MRFGTVTLFGRSNVGKSTFLNAVLEHDLSIVSPLPQTTRDALLGVVTRPDVQLAFVDTPGVHRPKTELGRRMNHAAVEAARTTDVVVFMTDAAVVPRTRKDEDADAARAQDAKLLKQLPSATATPSVLVVNKVDLVRDKSRLLPILDEYVKVHDFRAVVPISARRADGLERVLDELTQLVPEGPAGYDEDTLTDRPTRYFASEYVREQVLAATRGEVPHAVAVSIDRFEEGKIVRIAATLHVEKIGQRKILVGDGGAQIKAIGTAARQRIEALVGRKVFLELFVRVSPRWKDAPRQLAELGYAPAGRKADDDGGLKK